MSDHADAVAQQRAYYEQTAATYDDEHVHEDDAHTLALCFLLGVVDFYGVRSILDIGSGTGRALLYIKERRPDLRLAGIEPSGALREVGYAKGLAQDELVDGDATKLSYEDGAFDLVVEFAALHHIPEPRQAVAEMLRVARVGVLISDANNFGQGSRLARAAKQAAHKLGLWPLVNRLKTGGKGYSISEGDGLFYSYSVFDEWSQVRRACRSLHVLNTRDASGPNPYRSAGSVALLGIK